MATKNETISVLMDIEGEEFDVQGASIHEAVSEIGQLSCQLSKAGATALPEPETLLGKAARLDLKLRDSDARRDYHGIVVEAVRRADAEGRPSIDCVIVPRLWRLTKRTNCRIFQDKTVVEIVTEVLEEAGMPATAQTWNTNESYPARVFCCQYRETDYDFVARLLAEEGIIFAVTHDEDEDKILFGDEATGLGDIAPSTLPFRTLQGFDFLKPQVTNLQRVHTVKPDKVELRDYDFVRPSFQLKGTAPDPADEDKTLEVFSFPGRFVEEGVGKRYAKVLLHAMQAEADVLEGETSVMSFKVGHRVTFEEHPFDELNGEWMVVSMESATRGGSSFYDREGSKDFGCRFTAVPTATSVYKAPRRDAVSAIAGTQTVFTTGASGSEIHPDEYGRIKARFLWDRSDPQDDTSSCWIRTEQANTPDSMFLPRVGWEVSVRFHDGDVDRPFCFGRLYNALAPPPYKLPDGKARSSLQTATSPGDGSSNELRMDDSGGGEEMFVNASKDLTINVKNNMSMQIGNNEIRSVGSNHTLAISNSIEISIGANNILDVGGNQDVKVETYMLDDVGGDHTLTVGGNRDMQVGGDHKHTVSGDQTLDVGSLQTDLVVGEVAEKADGDLSYEGGALIEITAGNRDLTVAGDRTEMVGLAKVVGTIGGRSVEIGGDLTNMVAGAIIHKVKGDKSNKSAGAFTDLVAGAQIIKAEGEVSFEGEDLVAVVMGASVLLVSKPVVMLAGTSVKWDGETTDEAILIVDN